MNEEELKKGCGKPLEELRCGEKWDSVFIYCGDVIGTKKEYCPTCQARLEGYTLAREDFEKQSKEKLDYTLNHLVGLNKLDANELIIAVKNTQNAFEDGYNKATEDVLKKIDELIKFIEYNIVFKNDKYYIELLDKIEELKASLKKSQQTEDCIKGGSLRPVPDTRIIGVSADTLKNSQDNSSCEYCRGSSDKALDNLESYSKHSADNNQDVCENCVTYGNCDFENKVPDGKKGFCSGFKKFKPKEVKGR